MSEKKESERGYPVRTGLLDPASLRRGCDLVWSHTPPFLDRARQARGTERYWAYVLDAPDQGNDDNDDALVVLPDPELKLLPPPIASKPFIVSMKNVYAVSPWQIPDHD